MATVSKNQRAGKVSIQPVPECKKGHTLTWVNYAARGRKNMQQMCPCNGWNGIAKAQ